MTDLADTSTRDDPRLAGAPLLLGRYRPLQRIGRGGTSSVFRGHDESTGRDIAIKLFPAGGDVDIARYEQELRVLAGLNHHGVVSVIDAGIDRSTPTDPRPFLVMQLVEGTTLRATLTAGSLTEAQIGGIAFEVAEALDYVHHRGVIHRDISPSNIMIADYGTRSSRPRALVTDFGIAVDAGTTRVPGEGVLTATASYVSPEQVRGQPPTPSVDVYALGLVVLECFTRVIEYDGTPEHAALAHLQRDPRIPDSVPVAWAQLIRRMTSARPDERPAAADVAAAVRGILATP